MRNSNRKQWSRSGLHNSGKLEGPNYQHKFAEGRKNLFHFNVELSMEEILEGQFLIRGRVFATFSTIEKALAGRKKCFREPHEGS